MPGYNFGYTTQGASQDTNSGGFVVAGSFTLNVPNIVVSSISAFVQGGGTSNQVMRLVMYGDSSGVPTGLKGVTAEQTVTSAQAAGWITVKFPSSFTIATTGTYWLGYWFGTTNSGAKENFDTGGSNGNVAATYSSGSNPPDPLTGWASGGTNKYSIYVTYTIGLTGRTIRTPAVMRSALF